MDPDGYAQAFLALVHGCTDEEITQVLGVVEASLRGMDAAVAAELQRFVDQFQVRVFTLADAR